MKSRQNPLHFFVHLLIFAVIFQSPKTFAQADKYFAIRDSIERGYRTAPAEEKYRYMIDHAGQIYDQDPILAKALIEEGMETAISNKDHAQVMKNYLVLLHFYNGKGMVNESISTSRLRIAYAAKHHFQKEKAFTHTILARFFMNAKIFDSAYTHTSIAHQIFKEMENYKGLAVVYDSYGILQVMQGNYAAANQEYNQAMEYVVKTDSANLEGIIHYHLGYSYVHTSDYDLAAMHIHRALEKWDPLTNIGLAPRWNALEMLGNIYIHLKKYDQALEYHRKALHIRKIAYMGFLVDSINLSYAYSYNNIADVYYHQNMLDSAWYYAELSLRIKLRPATVASRQDIANSYLNSAKILNKMGATEKVRMYAEEARNYYDQASWKDGLAETHLLLAQLDQTEQKPATALSHAKKAMEIARVIGSKSLQAQALKFQAELLSTQQRHKESNAALLRYCELNDSIYNADIQRRVTEMNIKYDTQRKETENQHLRENLTFQQTIQRYLFWALGMFLAFVMALAALLYFLRKNLKHKSSQLQQKEEINRLLNTQYQKEMEHKNRELHMLIESIKNKNDMLETIRSIMLEEIKQNCNAPVETFHRTVKTIQSHMTTDQNWELLERQISELSVDFRNKLLKLHPNLTPVDFKLLSYLKLQLPIREIAALMNITEDSVRKQKYRLRKKLDINEITLDHYLNSF